MSRFFVMYGEPAIVILDFPERARAEQCAKTLTKQSPYKHWVEEEKVVKAAATRKKKAVEVPPSEEVAEAEAEAEAEAAETTENSPPEE